VSKSCLEACKAARLVGFEIPKKIGLVPDTFTPENGMLTAAMKLKRNEVCAPALPLHVGSTRAAAAHGEQRSYAARGAGAGAAGLDGMGRDEEDCLPAAPPHSLTARMALCPDPPAMRVRLSPRCPVSRCPARGVSLQIVAKHKAQLEELYK
jgi:hypothetical protein